MTVGEAERESSKLKEYSIVAEVKETGVLRMNRDVQVGILQVDGGRPQRNQGLTTDLKVSMRNFFGRMNWLRG